MCSAFIINGQRCETGREFADAIGSDIAAAVNANVLPQEVSEDEWLDSCLCHVDRDKLQELTGVRYGIDSEIDFDAYVPVLASSLEQDE